MLFVIVKNDVVVGCCSCCSDADAMIFSCLDFDRFKKAFFDGPASAVRHNGQFELTDLFNLGSGTKQGDIQGPPLFNVVLNLVVYLIELNKGISQGVDLVEGPPFSE